ncbi:MAG: Crp/Fnr family transcriptional regulator [Anaerolineae bacterium]
MKTIPSRFQCLSAVDIFRDLTHEEIIPFLNRAPVRQVEARTLLYSPDEPTQVLYMVNDGRVQTYQLAPDGRMITSAILEAGTLFGEMALLGQTLQGHFAESVTACTLCVMDIETVRTLLLSDTRITFRILETLGSRLIELQQHIAVLTHKHVPERVTALLAQQAKKSRHSPYYEALCTHESLANMVGANRETVTKILNELRAQQVIELHRGRIVILDLQKLVTSGTSQG